MARQYQGSVADSSAQHAPAYGLGRFDKPSSGGILLALCHHEDLMATMVHKMATRARGWIMPLWMSLGSRVVRPRMIRL
jgi:hypothetical protein